MDAMSVVTSTFIDPVVRLVSPQSAIFWLYLASSLTFALLLFWYRDSGRPTLAQFWRYVVPAAIYRHPSPSLDLRYTIINAIVSNAVVVPLLVVSPSVAAAVSGGLAWGLGPSEGQSAVEWSSRLWLTLGLLIAADAAFYVSHALQHRFSILWEFHKVHHSAPVLTPLTVYRQHPVDDLVDGLFIGAATGVVFGIAGYCLDGFAEPLMLLECNVGVALFRFLGAHLRHSHIWLSYGPLLERILISPAQHQIHHSIDPQHVNRNFGGIFAIWDAVFGTLHLAGQRKKLTLGLIDGTEEQYRSVVALYMLPLRRLEHFVTAYPRRSGMRRLAHLVPLGTVIVLVLAAVLTVQSSLARAPKDSKPTARTPSEQRLQTGAGDEIVVVGKSGKIQAWRVTPKGRQSLKDGEYKLANGGAIRMKGGRIVWDQFGVVQKYEQGSLEAPVGIG